MTRFFASSCGATQGAPRSGLTGHNVIIRRDLGIDALSFDPADESARRLIPLEQPGIERLLRCMDFGDAISIPCSTLTLRQHARKAIKLIAARSSSIRRHRKNTEPGGRK